MTRDQAMDAATDHGPGWIAQDSDGSWYWYNEEPEAGRSGWSCKGPDSEHRFLGSGNERDAYCWGDSLEVVEA